MIKLFISYSHKDANEITDFITHLSPLKNNRTISEWIDRKIGAGEKYQNDIDSNLEDADIICLMISANFLASNACQKEVEESMRLRNNKGIRVIPIILSSCAWTEQNELSELLAIPTDGKPIEKFNSKNEGWLNVINSIKNTCNSINKINELEISDVFNTFLDSADILSKSHSEKEIIDLDDIYVYPRLNKYNDVGEPKKYDSKNFEKDILTFGKILIAGENQSGKTTLCKKLFRVFRSKNFIPVYIADDNKFLGNPIKKIEKALQKQYNGFTIDDADLRRIIPIVDNFHFAKYQQKYIEQYSIFNNQVLVVDDIFGLNIKNENLIKEYDEFKICEFSPIERDALIRNWIQIKESEFIEAKPTHLLQSLDEKTELIEASLGVIFGKGIMPSYPFFILSILAAQDIQKPLDPDITTQGHCYQALIYLYLRKEGVKNNQYDIYSNFLTELAYWIYSNAGSALSNEKFNEFIEYYEDKYNLPIAPNTILATLRNVNICSFDDLNHFNFCYSYIYYFFVAKYIAENIETEEKLVNRMLNNLHKDENAYITIFIVHHSKSNNLLEKLVTNAKILFEEYEPATLDSNELSFFDKHEDKIIKAVLPTYQNSVVKERKKILVKKAKNEEERKQEIEDTGKVNETSELARELRRSIKTVEVMGLVIKNRAGSLDKNRLEYLFEQGLKVHLRILSSFFEIIKNKDFEDDFVDFITERLNHIIEVESKNISIEKIEKLARSIFWNMNFGVVHGFITKAIHSLGSNNLLKISKFVTSKENTPATFIVDQGINMWYNKSVKVDEIAERIDNDGFSKTAERLMKFKIVEHSRLHKISEHNRKKIENKLKMSSRKLLIESAKNKAK